MIRDSSRKRELEFVEYNTYRKDNHNGTLCDSTVTKLWIDDRNVITITENYLQESKFQDGCLMKN